MYHHWRPRRDGTSSTAPKAENVATGAELVFYIASGRVNAIEISWLVMVTILITMLARVRQQATGKNVMAEKQALLSDRPLFSSIWSSARSHRRPDAVGRLPLVIIIAS